LTYLVPSPHKLGLQCLLRVAPPFAPLPHLFGAGDLEGALPPHSFPFTTETLRPPYLLGTGQAAKPDYHLDFHLTPRSFRVCPLGPFPGLSPPGRPGVLRPTRIDGYLLVGSQQFRRL
jgi:hypothetical protein